MCRKYLESEKCLNKMNITNIYIYYQIHVQYIRTVYVGYTTTV